MTTPHEQYNECVKQFVSFQWFVYAIVAVLITLVSISVAASVNFTEVKDRSIENADKIDRMEVRMDKKLDQILSIVKGQ